MAVRPDCDHQEYASACLWCALRRSHEAIDGRVRLRKHAVAHEQRHRPALARREEAAARRYRGRHGHGSAYFWEEVRDVLWADGMTKTHVGLAARGIVAVRADTLLVGEEMRDDQVCEILEAAQRVLSGAGYRAEVAWNRDPPRLYCAVRPVEGDLFS